jgi:hypothetical protein
VAWPNSLSGGSRDPFGRAPSPPTLFDLLLIGGKVVSSVEVCGMPHITLINIIIITINNRRSINRYGGCRIKSKLSDTVQGWCDTCQQLTEPGWLFRC